MKKIAILSSDQELLSQTLNHLKTLYHVTAFSDSDNFINALFETEYTILILDLVFKGRVAVEMFKKVRRLSPSSKIMVLSDTATIQDAVETTKLGASDFLRKPVDIDRLFNSIARHAKGDEAEIRLSHNNHDDAEWLFGSSVRIHKLFECMKDAVDSKKNILFVCENGINISVLADIVCKGSEKQFKKVSAIDLLSFQKESSENYFWGMLQEILSEKASHRAGACNILFFKNFEVISKHFQESILQYLEKAAIKSYGIKFIISTAFGGMDRIVELEKASLLKDFLVIDIPALRERKEDIPILLGTYLKKYSNAYGKEVNSVSSELLEALMLYDWPGNIVEFESYLETAVVNSSSSVLAVDSFPVNFKFIYNKLLKEFEAGVPIQTAETKLFHEILDCFRFKSNQGEISLSELLDIPKEIIPATASSVKGSSEN